MLGEFFQSTYIRPPDQESTTAADKIFLPSNSDSISELVIESAEVQHLLSNLNVNKSLGPDGVHPKLLKSLASSPSFVDSITKLFQKCYDTGKIPLVWKAAQITSLHKKGSKNDPCNYRPISLTCILSKIYEKLVRNHIIDHFDKCVNEQQHGFLEKKSCLSSP